MTSRDTSEHAEPVDSGGQTSIPTRILATGQRSQLWIVDVVEGSRELVLESATVLFEAPNWTADGEALILNGAGRLWRVPLAAPTLQPIPLADIPDLNNDHVLDPDGQHIYLSAADGQLYRAPLAGGTTVRITDPKMTDLTHFLHGVSPDGERLAFVGVRIDDQWNVMSAELYSMSAEGGDYRPLTDAGMPADGPEYSPDGDWIYLNTESFSGHAQIGRMRPDGRGLQRLRHSNTVDWFPHVSPDGSTIVYLAYPSGTVGHPADLWVDLMVVENHAWDEARSVVRLFGGQGTINVNSWSPDSRRFAYVAYPTRTTSPLDRVG